jgi:hypothetical protein
MILLNAVLNALSDSYPSEAEIIEMDSREMDVAIFERGRIKALYAFLDETPSE